MKYITTILFTILATGVFAQLSSGSTVEFEFADVEGKESVNGDDAIGMLKSYINGKTNLVMVAPSENKADFVMTLSVVKKGTKRLAKVVITQKSSGNVVFTSEWVKGRGGNFYYGNSGSRMAIGKLVKNDLIDRFPEISK